LGGLVGRRFLSPERHMPELPEVETMVRDLRPRVRGLTIQSVRADWEGEVIWPRFDEFKRRLEGQTITGIRRRGKYAIFELASGDLLAVHRGMSGSLLHRRRDDAEDPYVRVVFSLDDETELRLRDPRKFGKVFLLAASGEDGPAPWATMGPEPLNADFTADVLAARLLNRRALLKPLLLNQQIVAGLGNIYVDEAMYRARLHPERRANTLTLAEIRRLHGAIVDVLQAAVRSRGTTFSSYADVEGRAGGYQQNLDVFRRNGASCPACGTPIIRLVVGCRGTHVCPACQKV
jgi:formamidopyrimidine-DNA glycosylase